MSALIIPHPFPPIFLYCKFLYHYITYWFWSIFSRSRSRSYSTYCTYRTVCPDVKRKKTQLFRGDCIHTIFQFQSKYTLSMFLPVYGTHPTSLPSLHKVGWVTVYHLPELRNCRPIYLHASSPFIDLLNACLPISPLYLPTSQLYFSIFPLYIPITSFPIPAYIPAYPPSHLPA